MTSPSLYSSYRLRCADRYKKVGGTCIIVRYFEHYYLITARHCVDPGYRDPRQKGPLPTSILVDGFAYAGLGLTVAPVSNTVVEIDRWAIDENDNDLIIGRIQGHSSRLIAAEITALLVPERLLNASLGGKVVFSGYPSEISSYDPRWPALVVRQGIIAAHPQLDISIPKAIGRSYGLIDAYSQTGFSGSPIWLEVDQYEDLSVRLRRILQSVLRLRSEPMIRKSIEVRVKPISYLIGINCGHFKDTETQNPGSHAGLSYYVKSSAIIRTLKALMGIEILRGEMTVAESKRHHNRLTVETVYWPSDSISEEPSKGLS